jgi:hypothetical protein
MLSRPLELGETTLLSSARMTNLLLEADKNEHFARVFECNQALPYVKFELKAVG